MRTELLTKEQQPERLWTKREVADFLRCSSRTVENYCSARLLPFIQLPAGKRFRPEDVRSFLEARTFNHVSLSELKVRA